MAKGRNSYIRKEYEKLIKQIKICMYCGGTDRLAIDHIYPPKIGGDSSLSNLTRACIRCNGIKTDKHLDDFLVNVLVKRKETYIKATGYLSRLRKQLNLNHRANRELVFWLDDKIEYARKEHTYFTNIIHSLITESFRHNTKEVQNG